MASFWLILCFVLTGLAVVQGLLLWLQAYEHCRYARSCMQDLQRQRSPGRALVFAPCKDLDSGMEENLRALLQQDDPDYEVVFIVEDRDDRAYPVILRLLTEPRRCGARVVVAGRARHNGQKVHNLRVATGYLDADVRYLAFVDSDARPRPEWLRLLLARLDRPELGAATGYRWFVASRPSLAYWVLSSINSGITMLLGRSSHNLVWGGSWAIRRELFDALGVRQAWQGTLSDDLVVSQMLRRSGYETRFEPAAIVVSPLETTAAQAFSFLRRQYLISRSYVPSWWWFGLAVSSANVAMWAAALALAVSSFVAGAPNWFWGLAPITAMYALSAARAALRQSLVGVYFPERVRQTAAAAWFDILAAPVGLLVNWLGFLSSAFGSQVHWRNKTYRILRNGKVRLISAEPTAATTEPHIVLHFRLERTPSAARRRFSRISPDRSLDVISALDAFAPAEAPAPNEAAPDAAELAVEAPLATPDAAAVMADRAGPLPHEGDAR